MRESTYRVKLINKLETMFPGCVILKLDPREQQGIPDIIILFNNRWAMLELKFAPGAHEQPNQRYYVDVFDKMSFAAFINPEIEEEVLDDLQQSFGALR